MLKKTDQEPPVETGYPKLVDTRLNQLHFSLEDLKVDALVITYLPNIRYLTNFSGSEATVFLSLDEIHFITDDRYEEQIKTELYDLPNLHKHIDRDVWTYALEKGIMQEDKIETLAFEADKVSYDDAVKIRNQIRPIKFKPAPNLVEPFTVPKAAEELAYIQSACDIAVEVYEKLLTIIKPGITENEIAIEIAHQSRLLGSEGDPFDIIVVSGNRGGLVHGSPSDRKLRYGDIVIMDFGCKVHGFISDITRTIAIGRATKEQKALYKLLYRAKEAAIDGVRPGMNGKTLDKIARGMIDKEGFGKYFQHSLGHGIGLVPHEKPTITFRKDDQIVPDSCVIAIEPGVYIPDKYGMRIEDNALVTRNGGKHLTKAPEDIVVI